MSAAAAPTPAVSVIGIGACTPVGADVASTAAAVRAGISGFALHSTARDRVEEPVRVAAVPWLDPGMRGASRFAALLRPALEQALQPWWDAGIPSRLGLALALPERRPGLEPHLEGTLLREVRTYFEGAFESVATFSLGHAAGAVAMEAAMRKLQAMGMQGCVVAGVDTYLDEATLHWLEAEDQLHGAGFLNNAWGFIPGEGAGALLLARSDFAERLGMHECARAIATGLADEKNRIKTESVCLGEGLTVALQRSLDGLPRDAQVTDIYCDMNGEPYRADEYGFSVMRVGEALADASDFVAPADCWGDVGAAGVPLHAMLAAVAGAKCYARGRLALVWASSEGGRRGALLLRIHGED